MRIIALTVTVALPLAALPGVVSAAPVGSATWCAHHPKLAKTKEAAACAASASGGGGATGNPGGTTPNLIVTVSPDPVQEVGTSEADFVVQITALPVFANQTVTLSSQQLALACTGVPDHTPGVTWRSSASGAISEKIGTGMGPKDPVTLDNDGNATVEVQGEDCAPGIDLVEADLTKAPFTTVTTQLTLLPPATTTEPLVTAAPNPEVETGDGGPGDAPSQVYVNFLIEENPVYAEGTVEVTSEQLTARCGLGTPVWTSTGGTPITSGGTTIGTTAVLDDDGNADVTFEGLSCAPGPSLVDVDLIGGTHDTFSTTYTINPPASVMPTVPVL